MHVHTQHTHKCTCAYTLSQAGIKVERWPEGAGTLRKFLQTLPGIRPAWQVCECGL